MCRFNHAVAPAAPAPDDELGGPVFDDLSGLNMNWLNDSFPLPEFKNEGKAQMIKAEDAFTPDSNDLDMAEELDLFDLFKDEEIAKPASSASQPGEQGTSPPLSKLADSTSGGNFCCLNSGQQQTQQLAAAQLVNPALLGLNQPIQNFGATSTMPVEQLLAMQNAAVAATMINPLQAQLLQNLSLAQPFLGASIGLPLASKACKGGAADLAVEDNAIEKIKQKRRESAQRSRARKNTYMRQLEFENRALKEEVIKLTQALSKIQKDLQAGNISLPANQSSSNNTHNAAGAVPQAAGAQAASFSQMMMAQ